MSVLLFLAVATVILILAGKFYGGYVARQVGEDRSRPTPAQTINDGRDYVPTKPYILFAHHFATIAGAAPILGPTAAIIYGFVPAWLWVVLGGVFIGAVHDFTALFVSVREGGRSIAEVAKKTMGGTGFVLFILFAILMLLLVTSAFLAAVSTSLTSLWPLDKLGLEEGQHLLKTVVQDGVAFGRIGGIASTSVIVVTCFAPLLGYLIYRRRIRAYLAYVLGTILCVGSVLLGFKFPITLPPDIWTVIIAVYVFIAAGLPVWFLLQPRDFVNVHILYAGIALMFTALVAVGIKGAEFVMPAFNVTEGVSTLGFIWPMMFITIACGAISGFHSLAAGGTTSKQLGAEKDARRIGFNAMLLESLMAVCVLLVLAVGLRFVDYKAIMWPAADSGLKQNPVLAFSLGVGSICHRGFGIPIAIGTVFGVLLVEGFAITTLDTAVRLNRYLFEELWGVIFRRPPALFRNFWFNSGICVVLMWVLAYTNAFMAIWPIFGAANQLLAALGMITVTVWLLVRGRRFWYVLAPAIFMLITTIASLVILFGKYLAQENYVLLAGDVLLMLLAVGIVILALRKMVRRHGVREAVEPST